MSSFVEKLSGLEEQIRLLQTKIEPFAERAERLNRSVETLAAQAKSVGEESVALVDELAGMRSEIESISTVLADAKTEGVKLDAVQEVNKQLHDSMTEMFGETFQVVSRFFDTARKLGLVEKDKEPKFLDKKELEDIKEAMTEPESVEAAPEPVAEAVPAEEVPTEPVEEPTEEPEVAEAVPEPVAEEATPEVAPEPVAEEVSAEEVPTEPVEEPIEEPEVAEAVPEPVAEETTEESEESDIFDGFSDADFMPDTPAADDVALPSLPDVTASDVSSVMETDVEPESEDVEEFSEEIADQLDLPPLQLGTSETVDETDNPTAEEEQQIEDLLNDLSKPIST